MKATPTRKAIHLFLLSLVAHAALLCGCLRRLCPGNWSSRREIAPFQSTDRTTFAVSAVFTNNHRDGGSVVICPAFAVVSDEKVTALREELKSNPCTVDILISKLDKKGKVLEDRTYKTSGWPEPVWRLSFLSYACFPAAAQRVEARINFRRPVPPEIGFLLDFMYLVPLL